MTVRRFLPLLLLSGACSSATGRGAVTTPAGGSDALNTTQLDSLWSQANAAYQAGKWRKAIEEVERFNLEAPRDDARRVEAHYLLGEAHLAGHQRLEAAREFRRVSDETPTHKLAPEALLHVGDAYAELWRRPELDPTYGQTALSTYQELVNRYPDSDAATQAKARIDDLNDKFALKEYKAARDPGLRPRGGLLDAQLRQAGLVGRRHPADPLHFLDVLPGPGGEVGGQPLHVVRAAPGVDHPGGAGLLLQQQLGVAGDAGGEVTRQRECLVQRVGVQRLGVPLGRGHRLAAGPHDVVEDVLSGQGPARGLAVRTQ